MKYSFSKIAKRLTFVVALVFVIAFLLFALIYNIGKECLDFYFESSSYIQNKEEPYIESLQEYVTNKHIKLDECDKLEDWIKEHKVTYALGFAFMFLTSYIQTLFPKVLGDTIDILKVKGFNDNDKFIA